MVQDQIERRESDEVRYSSLSNRRQSLDEASYVDQDDLRALIEYVERVVDDLLTLPVFIVLVNVN
jgi:hypothetical protein